SVVREPVGDNFATVAPGHQTALGDGTARIQAVGRPVSTEPEEVHMLGHLQQVRFGLSCLVLSLAARGAAAHQFQEQSNILPVPTNYWTEAVVPVDADEDGRWDVLFVHANGWEVPGDFAATGTFPLPPIVLVNQGPHAGNPVFVDQSAAYLPAGLTL